MAQDTKPDATEASKPEDDSAFHYYSGGEVKELAGTRVPPALWGFYLILGCGALAALFLFGAIRPAGVYQPGGGSAITQAAIQKDLNTGAAGSVSLQTANRLDLTRILLPTGQTLQQAETSGADVYQTYCIGCHGQNQDGNGVNAASLNPKPRNLRDAPFMQAMSYQRIYTSVHKGVPGTAMPRWENALTEDQMRQAIAYVLSLTAPAQTVEPTGAPETVQSQPKGTTTRQIPNTPGMPDSVSRGSASIIVPVTPGNNATAPKAPSANAPATGGAAH